MNNPIEPHADMRTLATAHRQMYLAWTEAGFTEEQALRLLRAWVHAVMSS